MKPFLTTIAWHRLFQGRQGFSLLEMAIVLTIIAIITGSALSVALTQDGFARIQQTNVKFDAIEKAIAAYVKLNKYLPCPALGNLAPNNANFGLENRVAGECVGNWNAGGNVQAGVVPVRTLNLPDEFIVDGWDGRITYVMDKRLQTQASFLAADSAAMDTITVQDINSVSITTDAVIVLISHGKNGYGAWQKSGTQMVFFTTGLDASEMENSHANSATTAAGFNATFVQRSPSAAFDDIVRFKTKEQLVRMSGASIRAPECGNATTVINDTSSAICRGSQDMNCINYLTSLANTVNILCQGN